MTCPYCGFETGTSNLCFNPLCSRDMVEKPTQLDRIETMLHQLLNPAQPEPVIEIKNGNQTWIFSKSIWDSMPEDEQNRIKGWGRTR